jgi:hypothetical protein
MIRSANVVLASDATIEVIEKLAQDVDRSDLAIRPVRKTDGDDWSTRAGALASALVDGLEVRDSREGLRRTDGQ